MAAKYKIDSSNDMLCLILDLLAKGITNLDKLYDQALSEGWSWGMYGVDQYAKTLQYHGFTILDGTVSV